MCNTDNNNQCCHEADLLCCAPLMHCCGGYSEHNNCCPHDRCCNRPCGGCCDPCGNCDKPMCCCCYKLKKAFDKFKEEVLEEVNNIRGRIKVIEQDIENKYNELSEYITYLNEHAVTNVTYKSSTKYLRQTINGQTTDIIKILPYDESITDIIYNTQTKFLQKKVGSSEPENIVNLDFGVSYDSSTKYLSQIKNGVSSRVVKIIPDSDKGVANGVAPLNSNKKIEKRYLPDIELTDLPDSVSNAFNGATKTGNTIKFTRADGSNPFSFTLPDAPGTLNTNNSAKQSVSSSESLSGTIKLHKISKTGSFDDLNDTPTFTIEGDTYNLEETINKILNRLKIVEGLWTDNGTTLTAKNGRSATAAGFYDSTVN